MKYRRMRLAFVVGLVMLIILSSLLIADAAWGRNASDTRYKYYTSIEVQSGDTLLTIADQYMTAGYKNKKAYVNELMSINGLSDSRIHAGEYLTVPYYSYAKRD